MEKYNLERLRAQSERYVVFLFFEKKIYFGEDDDDEI